MIYQKLRLQKMKSKRMILRFVESPKLNVRMLGPSFGKISLGARNCALVQIVWSCIRRRMSCF